MIEDNYTPPRYPFIRAIVSYGMYVAALSGMACLVAGVLAAVSLGSLWWLAAGTLAGALVAGAIGSYVEVLRIISDTLIPR